LSFVLILSRLASWAGLTALLVSLALDRSVRRPARTSRIRPMALATFALGMALFALFFGLVAACDRLRPSDM